MRKNKTLKNKTLKNKCGGTKKDRSRSMYKSLTNKRPRGLLHSRPDIGVHELNNLIIQHNDNTEITEPLKKLREVRKSFLIADKEANQTAIMDHRDIYSRRHINNQYKALKNNGVRISSKLRSKIM